MMKWLTPRKYRWILQWDRIRQQETPDEMKEWVKSLLPWLLRPNVRFPSIKK